MPATSAPTRLALAIPIALAVGCVTGGDLRRDWGTPARGPSGAEPAVASGPSAEEAIQAVLAAARATLGQSKPEIEGRRLPTDCSGYLRGLYTLAGVDLFSEGLPSDNGVRAMVRWVERRGVLHRHKVPHAGLVEQVLADGTVLIIHATNHGIVREPMNLFRPREEADPDGRVINAPLRRKTSRDPPRMPRLMSELFAGFGTVLPRPPASASRL